MRKLSIALVLAAIAVGAFADGAQAGTKVLAGTYSQSQIEKACSAAGGVSTTKDNGGYGCYATGGDVECTSAGKCTGRCATCGGPAIAHGGKGTVFGVLSGSTLKAGNTIATKNTSAPPTVRRPVAESYQGGMNSTEPHGGKK
jgi:hypothetical protein